MATLFNSVCSIVFVLFLFVVSHRVIGAGEQISRTSNVHQIYDNGPEWTGHSNPYSRNKKYRDQYYDPSSYYPQTNNPQNKDYGYAKPTKGKDNLWDFFENLFDKKNQWEEEIWDLIFHKEEEKGHYGEPSVGYHGHKDKPLSKEKIFEKIKLLAIAATVLLIVLGGGILLAPLAVGKGRRSLSEFFPQEQNVGANGEIARLASNVLQAIQNYQQLQTRYGIETK